ncbi:MAG TPA: cytochrome c biogenesis protein CcdA [Polyangia bacterium]|jgi:Thiol:disulfide interchange protein|nr:cytochrome c biogenesis protein CcdA [Polyangia bacterium]
MDRMLFWATDALNSSLVVAFGAALLWGVFSVLLSPCHLGTIPLVIGMVGSSTRGSTRRGRGALLSFSFAGGMLIAIAVLGVLVATLGYAVQGFSSITNYVIAAIFLAAGLHLVGIVSIPLPSLTPKAGKRKGVVAAVAIGVVFGLGLSPCTFAFLAPILGVTLGSAATSPLRGMALLLAFGVGHCSVIGLAGSSTEFIQRYLDWNERSKALTVLKTVCGVLVIVAAGVLIYTA